MAYMSQERKKAIQVKVKPILAKYGMKGTLSVRHHSTLVLNLTAGPIDFAGDVNQDARSASGNAPRTAEDIRQPYALSINPYWYQEHYVGKSLEFLKEIFTALNEGNHDRSDLQSDYFDVGWYVDVNVGKYDKPYQVTA